MRTVALILLSLTLISCRTSGPATPTTEDTMKVTVAPAQTSWLSDEKRWEVLVDVTFENTSDALFQLDKVTACDGGRIQNDVFVVRLRNRELDYRGMMKKRAPPGPDGFHRLEPGESVTERVDLGSQYDLPSRGGTLSVQFDHYNHFSPDEVQLVSEPVDVELRR